MSARVQIHALATIVLILTVIGSARGNMVDPSRIVLARAVERSAAGDALPLAHSDGLHGEKLIRQDDADAIERPVDDRMPLATDLIPVGYAPAPAGDVSVPKDMRDFGSLSADDSPGLPQPVPASAMFATALAILGVIMRRSYVQGSRFVNLTHVHRATFPARVEGEAPARQRGTVLGCLIDAVCEADAVSRIMAWADERASRYVCACNVHSVVTGSRDPVFRRVIENADLAVPDGMPVAWALRLLRFRGQTRVSGPDLMWGLCRAAAERGVSIFLFGSTDDVLKRLSAKVTAEFPGIRIAGTMSPPYRPLTPQEDELIAARINASGAGIAFTALGCPKQELWMAGQHGAIRATMIGVGAAFEFHAGVKRRAPRWMRRTGLEWVHRLFAEPRRLWKRYLVTNTAFVAGFAAQLCTAGRGRRKTAADAPLHSV